MLETVKVLVLLTVTLFVFFELTVLVELGPVLLTEPLLLTLLEPIEPALELVLLTDNEVEAELLLLALPLVAPPPVVLPAETALPENAPWKLPFVTPTMLWLVALTVFDVVERTWLLECGPVSLMVPVLLAPAIPPPSPASRPSEVTADAV